MRPCLLVTLVLAVLTAAPGLHAADPSVGDCLSATETSLTLRAENKLRAARAQLLVCSASSCPPQVRDECAHRMDELNAAAPTVVFTVKTAAGQELSAVKVTMDGEVVADHLDGGALSLDPGGHQFTFDVAGAPPMTKAITLHEGEKARAELIVIGLPAPEAPVATAAESNGRGNGQRVLGLVVGGVGVAGLIAGGIFGGLATSSWSTAKNECPRYTGCSLQAVSDRNSASTFATVSTVGFIAGGVLLAGGLTLYLTAPKDKSRSLGIHVLAPGGLAVTGRF